MAWLKSVLTKPRYALAVGLWNAFSIYLGSGIIIDVALLTLINTIGNLIIVWLGVEGGQRETTQD